MFQLLIIAIFKDHHYILKDTYSIGTYFCQLSIVKHTTVSRKNFVDWWMEHWFNPLYKIFHNFQLQHACT